MLQLHNTPEPTIFAEKDSGAGGTRHGPHTDTPALVNLLMLCPLIGESSEVKMLLTVGFSSYMQRLLVESIINGITVITCIAL